MYSVVEINHGKRGNRRSADTEVIGKGPLERKPRTLRIEPLYPYAATPLPLRRYPSTLTPLSPYPFLWLFKVYGKRGATRDHESRRGEGSALPIRWRLAATRLETSSFAPCATEDKTSRRCRRVPAARSGFFAAPEHEMPPSRHTKIHEILLAPKGRLGIGYWQHFHTGNIPS